MSDKKILIIDDEFPMRYLIEHQLKREGFDVALAKDGPDGLTAVSKHKPDLVVLDVMMPGMDGFTVCENMRADEQLSRVPVIMLSAKTDVQSKRRGLEVGAAKYLTKPISPDDLTHHVRDVLRHTRKDDSDSPSE